MAYIGREPQIGNFQVCDAISVVNNQAAYTMQVSSVNVIPETANHCLVSLNGILQAPGSSFTVAGSTITFASALVTNDVINFIQILGSVLDLGVPSDRTVTLAKLASGTDGNLISYDTSGNPVAVATGNDGQVLTSAGAGAVPTFETPSGGSWTLVSSTTASNNSHVDFTFSGSYSIYKITFVNMIGGTDNTNLNHQILIGGSVQTGSTYAYGNLFVDSNGGNGYNASGDAGSVKMTYAPMGSATNDNTNGEILIFNPSSSIRTHTAYRFTGDQKVGTYLNTNVGGSRWNNGVAWSGFRVLYSSGNIASGVMKLWGQA